MNFQIIGDYILEYENIDDYIILTIWKTYRNEILPFSECIARYHLKPERIDNG